MLLIKFEDTKEEIDLKDVKEDDLALNDSQNDPQEKEAAVEPEVKLSKKEILVDSTALSKDSQMLAFVEAVCYQLKKDKWNLGCYDEWDDDLKEKIPMDMLVNDLELEKSEEELREMPADELYTILDNLIYEAVYAEAVRKKEEREEELKNQAEKEKEQDELDEFYM